ncbi:MAG: hypothetical protein WD734_02740 [Dehalococcoidia bacterium]
MTRARRLTDLWFRAWGVAALAALLVTLGSLLAGIGDWRLPFVLAHLAALSALVSLGTVLVVEALVEGHRAEGSTGGMTAHVLRRHGVVVALLGVVAVTIAVSLANFEDGVRWVRTAANLSTVAIIVVLVARYLRSGRPAA